MDRYFATSQLNNPRTPRKLCTLCGGTILWRRRLATNWDKVLYCSASCRRISVARVRTAHDDHVEVYDHSAAEWVGSAA
jgi:hypothetical protein